jgi:hypothetical protein
MICRHCEEQSDEAIQGLEKHLDCFADARNERLYTAPSLSGLVLLPPLAAQLCPIVEPLADLALEPALHRLIERLAA